MKPVAMSITAKALLLLLFLTILTATAASAAPAASPANPAVPASTPVRSIGLQVPGQVRAGESFAITLFAEVSYPYTPEDEAAFYEYRDGMAPRLLNTAKLNEKGQITLTVDQKTAGDYTYKAILGALEAQAALIVLPAAPERIEAEEESFFRERGRVADVRFIVKDAFGNHISAGAGSGQYVPARLLRISVTGPDGKALTNIALATDSAGDALIRFTAGQTGDYLASATLTANETSGETLVKIRDFGAVSGIAFIKDEDREPWLQTGAENGLSSRRNRLELAIELIGDYDLRRPPTAAEESRIIFSTNKPELLLVEKISGGQARLTERGKPGLATLTATYLPQGGQGIQGAIELRLSGRASRINFKTAIKTLTATVDAALLDQEGQPAFTVLEDYALILPPGLDLITKSPLLNGKAAITLQADKYGAYNVTVMTGDGLVGSVLLNFEQAILPAKNVVVFVGERSYFKDGEPAMMSHAPWVSYSHVFVPVTFLADIFAAEIVPSTSTRTIILRSADKEIVVDQAALTLSVTEKGFTTTQPIGSLFLQSREGAWFLPSVTIARLFGAEADYLPKQGPIEHVTIKTMQN